MIPTSQVRTQTLEVPSKSTQLTRGRAGAHPRSCLTRGWWEVEGQGRWQRPHRLQRDPTVCPRVLARSGLGYGQGPRTAEQFHRRESRALEDQSDKTGLRAKPGSPRPQSQRQGFLPGDSSAPFSPLPPCPGPWPSLEPSGSTQAISFLRLSRPGPWLREHQCPTGRRRPGSVLGAVRGEPTAGGDLCLQEGWVRVLRRRGRRPGGVVGKPSRRSTGAGSLGSLPGAGGRGNTRLTT